MSEIKQSNKKFQFSIAALNDVLTETKSVKKKLSPFIARFQKYQMSQIYQTLSHLHKCMTTPKSTLIYKFNSIFALKVLLDSSDYVLVNWIETFFLPHIIDIAKYYLQNNGQGKNYFISLGYSTKDDPGVQKMGFNYVLLAIQLIQVGAKVKPYKLFQNSFLEDKSDFSLAFQQLIINGYKSAQKLSFYPKQEIIQAQVSKFEQNLNSLSDEFIDIYSEFSNAKLYQYLQKQHGSQNQKYDISIVQILESGDLFVSSPAIEICKAELKQPQALISFKNSLSILHRIFLSADFQAFFVLNFEDTLKESLIEILGCDKNDRSIKRGSKFLSKFKNPEESKKIYLTYLSNLQKWSAFASVYAGQNENLLKKIVSSLKQNLKIELPKPQNLQAQRKRFQSMRERNMQRNIQLSEQIEKKPSALEEILQKLKQQASSIGSASEIKPVTQTNIIPSKVSISSNNNITPAPPSGRNQTLPFAKRLKYIEEVLHRLPKEPQNYEMNKGILLDFNSKFEEQLLMVPQNVFDQFSEKAFSLQKDIEDAVKLGYKNEKSNVKQQKKIQQKVQVRRIESQVYDEPQKSHKSIAKQQQARQSKKQFIEPVIDTPVKKFEFEQSSQKNHEKYKVQELGYKVQNNIPIVNSKLEEKQQKVTNQIQKVEYKVQQHERKQSFSVKQSQPKQKLGYEFLQESNKQKQYNHPLDLGYHNVQQKQQNSRLSNKSQSRSQQILSNRSIRKTEDLSQSRKKLQESSINANSKVQHFSPESSLVDDFRQYDRSDFKKKGYEIHQEEFEIPLEEHMNQNASVNKPKEFKSLSANRQLKSKISENINLHISPQRFDEQQISIYKKKPSQPSQPVLAFSNVSSPLDMSSNHNIAKPQYAEMELQQEELFDQDEICPPHINPLEESFHDINEIQQKIKSNIVSDSVNNGDLSFKNCFQTDKYILQRQEQKKNKLYWLQTESTNLVKNIILKKQKNKSSRINIPQLLNEKNIQHQSQIKAVEEEKNSRIKELESKIKNLEKQSQFMKTQLNQHIEEIKTLKANSQYDKESVGQRGYLQDMQNITAQKRNSPSKFGFSASRGFKLDTSNVKQNSYLDPKGKLINSKVYKQYFQKFRRQKDKKTVLKSKDLLHKDKDIEIGFMSKKQGEKLLITIFVTPQKDIEAFYWTIIENEGLQIESEPKGFISYIKGKKQEKIFFTVEVKTIHYRLPQVEFSYTIQQQKQVTKIMLPCSFHKFFFIKESDEDFEQWFKVNQKIIRGEQVPYSKRLLKNFDNLREYFQCMTVLNKGAPNSQGQICYGGFATYKRIQFPVRICIKPNQFLYIQGVNQSRDSSVEIAQVIQYYVSLLTHLLMKEID